MVKLHIEMTIADFIAKIVKSSHSHDYAWDLRNINGSEGEAGAATNTTSQTAAQPTPSSDSRRGCEDMSAEFHSPSSDESPVDLEGDHDDNGGKR